MPEYKSIKSLVAVWKDLQDLNASLSPVVDGEYVGFTVLSSQEQHTANANRTGVSGWAAIPDKDRAAFIHFLKIAPPPCDFNKIWHKKDLPDIRESESKLRVVSEPEISYTSLAEWVKVLETKLRGGQECMSASDSKHRKCAFVIADEPGWHAIDVAHVRNPGESVPDFSFWGLSVASFYEVLSLTKYNLDWLIDPKNCKITDCLSTQVMLFENPPLDVLWKALDRYKSEAPLRDRPLTASVGDDETVSSEGGEIESAEQTGRVTRVSLLWSDGGVDLEDVMTLEGAKVIREGDSIKIVGKVRKPA